MKKKTRKKPDKPDETVKILDLSKKEDIEEFEKEVNETLEKFTFDTIVHF